MILKFIPHAQERMKKRGISKENILSAIKYPFDNKKQNDGRLQVFGVVGNTVLKVIYEEKRNYNLIISAMWYK